MVKEFFEDDLKIEYSANGAIIIHDYCGNRVLCNVDLLRRFIEQFDREIPGDECQFYGIPGIPGGYALNSNSNWSFAQPTKCWHKSSWRPNNFYIRVVLKNRQEAESWDGSRSKI